MKKAIGIIGIAAALVASVVQPLAADQLYQEVTVTVTNGGTAYSSPLTVAGYLDKIEYIHGRGTSTFTVATFTGTTAIDTFATKQVTAAGSGVIRPRTVGTTTGGTALAAAVGAYAETTNALGQVLTNWVATTTLSAPYERFRIGGNCKIKLVEDDAGDASAITNVYRIYLVPSDK